MASQVMRILKEGFCPMAEITSTRGAARAQEPTVGPWLAYDLGEQIEQLQQEPYWQSGRNSKTIVHHEDFRMVVTAIQANTTIHEHRTAGRLAVQILRGHMRMHANGEEFDLPAGRILVVDQAVPYDMHAIEDSAFLLTIAWPGGDR
jgi:quercetin dioxygenase-like cupin family protein